MTGAELIAQERQRQIQQEGWTADHDDEHDSCELSIAAACYALHGTDASVSNPDEAWNPATPGWPWEDQYWKPKDDIKNLVRAGALIAAEIDRVLRLAGEDNLPT